MKPSRIIALSARLENTLDEVLFREKQPGDSVDDHKTVKGAVLAGAGVAGVAGASKAVGSVKSYANSPAVNDRLAGLRITVPGFTKQPAGAQRVQATASRAVTDLKQTVASIGRDAAYHGRGVINTADNAVRGGLKKTVPLVKRVGALARKLAN